MDHGAKGSEHDQDSRKAVEGEEKAGRLEEQGEQEPRGASDGPVGFLN
jgi:hypothetical protein